MGKLLKRKFESVYSEFIDAAVGLYMQANNISNFDSAKSMLISDASKEIVKGKSGVATAVPMDHPDVPCRLFGSVLMAVSDSGNDKIFSSETYRRLASAYACAICLPGNGIADSSVYPGGCSQQAIEDIGRVLSCDCSKCHTTGDLRSVLKSKVDDIMKQNSVLSTAPSILAYKQCYTIDRMMAGKDHARDMADVPNVHSDEHCYDLSHD